MTKEHHTGGRADDTAVGELESSDTVASGRTESAGGAGSPSRDWRTLSLSRVSITQESRDRYRLVDARNGSPAFNLSDSQLARGGMGRILCVFDTHTGREIVIKERLTEGAAPSRPGSAGSGATDPADARFLHEAKITAWLEHPNIVPVHEIGRREDGRLYYTMRRVRGTTLAAALAECGSLRERMEHLPHFLNLCNAIAFAHSRGVIHRDIKPQNVMVSTFGETVILDWGLAKLLGSAEDAGEKELAGKLADLKELKEGEAGTVAGFALGTPSYMPPEQAQGDIPLMDRRSDVYSLGAVLYEMLTGRPPFKGASYFEVVSDVISREPVPIRKIDRKVPKELAQIAHTAMSKDRDARYLDAGEMARRVQDYLSGKFVAPPKGGALAWLGWLAREKRGTLARGAALLLALLLGVSLHLARLAGVSRDLGAVKGRAGELAGLLEEQRRESTGLRALMASGQADAFSGTAIGLAYAAHAVELDDTPALRAKLYAEATAASYGIARGAILLGSRCLMPQSPAPADEASPLVCASQPPAQGDHFPHVIPAAAFKPFFVTVGPAPGHAVDGRQLHAAASAVAAAATGDVVLADAAGSVRVSDARGALKAQLAMPPGHERVTAVAVSATLRIAAADEKGDVTRLDIVSRGAGAPVAVGAPVRAIAFSVKDELYAVGPAGELLLLPPSGGEPLRVGQVCGEVGSPAAASLRPAPDGAVIVAAACAGRFEAGRIEGKRYVETGRAEEPEAGRAVAVDAGPGGAAIAFGTAGGVVGAVDLGPQGKGSCTAVTGHAGEVASVAWGWGGIVTSGADGFLKLWPPRGLKGHGARRIPPVPVAGQVLDVGADGRVLVSAGGALVLVRLGEPGGAVSFPAPGARAARISSDGGSVLVGGSDGTLRVARPGAAAAGGAAAAAAVPVGLPSVEGIWVLDRPGKRLAAIAAPGGEFLLYDYQGGRPLGGKRRWGEGAVAQVVADPSDIKIAVLYAGGGVAVGTAGEEKPFWKGEVPEAVAIAPTAEGKWLVAADARGGLFVIDFAGGGIVARPCGGGADAPGPVAGDAAPASCLRPLGQGGARAMAPYDAGRVVVIGQGGLVIYDAFEGRPVQRAAAGPGESALFDAAVRAALVVSRDQEGAQLLSLWPVERWLTDPPAAWQEKVRRATAYVVRDGILEPFGPQQK